MTFFYDIFRSPVMKAWKIVLFLILENDKSKDVNSYILFFPFKSVTRITELEQMNLNVWLIYFEAVDPNSAELIILK